MAGDDAAPDAPSEADAPAAEGSGENAGIGDDVRDVTDTDDAGDTDATADTEAVGGESEESAPARREPWSHVKIALVAGLTAVVALAALTGWLGFRTYQSHRAEQQHSLFLQVGRQGALNLTTIDYEHADADVQRILDSATGTFYDDFQRRAQPFTEVVKQAKSKSEGSIAEAGVLSSNDSEAQVLVAVTVKTSNAGAPDQNPRAWRMKISVERIGDDAKVSNVEFVP